MPEKYSATDELIGQTISGRYRILTRLGAGGMGTAYRAWDERAGVPVVIKIPNKRFLEEPDFAERFRREIRLLRRFVHPHIVPIVDDGEHAEFVFYVMRFLPGGSLSNRRLRDDGGRVKPNPPGMLNLWLMAVADALDHIHDRGVVHRDVKPANIFFDAAWGAFLGDFGIAKVVAESDMFDREQTLTATGMGLGTPDYMAPEQFTPQARVDGRVDQYALAVIVYEMVAGTRPYTGEKANLLLEIMTETAARLDTRRAGLPASLVAAVARGLAKRPEERFATCRDFATAVLQDVPPITDEPGVVRLLCPQCANLLKLPTSAAGRKGKCPKCHTGMKVADDLGAMWLLDEARRQEDVPTVGAFDFASSAATSDEPSGLTSWPNSTAKPIGRGKRHSREGVLGWIIGHGLALGTAMAIGALLLEGVRMGVGEGRGKANDHAISVLRDEKQELKKLLEETNERERSLQRKFEEASAREISLKKDLEKAVQRVRAIEADLAAAKEGGKLPNAPPGFKEPEQKPAQSVAPRLVNAIGMQFVLIPAGRFQMGSNIGAADERPVHPVRITKPFYLGVHEVTNADWKRIMGGNPPSKWPEDDRPVEGVTWPEANEFCEKLSQLPAEKNLNRTYRLPTEAEWEYAYRAGAAGMFPFGNDAQLLQQFAWFKDNAGDETHPVGLKRPNAWGLHDMHGNVQEWCSDWYGPYAENAVNDPQGPAVGDERVFRGGCWLLTTACSKCTDRFHKSPQADERWATLGFRVALSMPPEHRIDGEPVQSGGGLGGQNSVNSGMNMMGPGAMGGGMGAPGFCWVAREVYGDRDPRWLIFRGWMIEEAPAWLRELYAVHGFTVADWLRGRPVVKAVLRRLMDLIVEVKGRPRV